MLDKATSPRRVSAPLADRIGISLSGFCAAHCLIVPIAMAILPLWPVAQTLHAWTHPLLAVLLVPTTLVALRSARQRHLPLDIPALLALGLLVILLAWLLHDALGPWGESLVTLLGSAFLISGHWRNWYARRCP